MIKDKCQDRSVNMIAKIMYYFILAITLLVLCSVASCSHARVCNSFEEIITPAETSDIKQGSKRSVIRIRKTDDGRVIVSKLEACKLGACP